MQMNYGSTEKEMESLISRDLNSNTNKNKKSRYIRNIFVGIFGLMTVLFIVYVFNGNSNKVSTKNYVTSSSQTCSYEKPCPFGYHCRDEKCCKGFFGKCKNNNDCCKDLQCIKDVNFDESVCQSPPPKCKNSEECPLKYSKCDNGKCCKSDFKPCNNDGQCCGDLKCINDEDFGNYICLKPEPKKAASKKAPAKKASPKAKSNSNQIFSEEEKKVNPGKPEKCSYENPCPFGYKCGKDSKCCKGFFSTCKANKDCCVGLECIKDLNADESICQTPPPKCKKVDECPLKYSKCVNDKCCKTDFSKCVNDGQCCGGLKCIMDEDFGSYICLKPSSKKAPAKKAPPKTAGDY